MILPTVRSNWLIQVAYPGCHWGGAIYYLTNFSRKLHEIEGFLSQSEGRVSLAPPLDLPLNPA